MDSPINNKSINNNNTPIKRAKIKLSGMVQGVGFRPFVYRLAEKYGIKGYVLNNNEGVEISAEGKENDLLNFIKSLDSDSEKPPLSVIDNKTVVFIDYIRQGHFFYKTFEIKESDKTVSKNYNVKFNKSNKNNKLNLTIPPDIAICGKCLDELFNPSDRRYLYPFINCTDCGPRFTISKELPYDRASTAMDKFIMCPECLTEYKNPLSRRFHAEPNGCFACGPEAEFILSSDISKVDINNKINIRKIRAEGGSALSKLDNYPHNSARGIEEGTKDITGVLKLKQLRSLNHLKSSADLIRNGGIACVKGIGGFHLMADASNDDALRLLRERKNRPKKPFAVMFKDIEQASGYAYTDDISAGLLNSKERPICLLKDKGNLSYYVNCGLKDIGVFLPYAPLHYILLSLFGGPLVATSANIGGEPIVKDNAEAIFKLKSIADGFLIHNRDILRRCDDSVVKVDTESDKLDKDKLDKEDAKDVKIKIQSKNNKDSGKKGCPYFFVRRSRGYVPEPVKLPFNLKRNVLASGAFLKNAFALAYAGEDESICEGEAVEKQIDRGKAGADKKDNHNDNRNHNDNGGAVVLSQHNGDLENVAGFVNFKENIEDFEKFYNFKPDIIVYDSHPAYENTKWAKVSAEERNITGIPLQHHRAHVISCMAENGLELNEAIFGIAFDGTGYGDDETFWGGEFFKGNYKNLKRVGSFKKFRLLGGDKAVKSPKRVLLGILFDVLLGKNAVISHIGGNGATKYIYKYDSRDIKFKSDDILNIISDLTGFPEKEINIFLKMWSTGLNSPLTSSCGRIFDAVSCLCGFNGDITYEGEAAVYLENLSGKPDNLNSTNGSGCFKYSINRNEGDDFFTVDYNPMFKDIIQIILGSGGFKGLKKDGKIGKNMDAIYSDNNICKNIADRFMDTLVMIIKDAALMSGCKNVCMSGGVFQNVLLRHKAAAILKENGFSVYFNEKIPTNDGGIALGQAVYGGVI